MIDSIIAGTGNSRYLRSSIPAGTTWDDVLTMLRAGTFPIDLAGINAAGFTTLGTALNAENLLASATITALGLSSDATPDDALNALITAVNAKLAANQGSGNSGKIMGVNSDGSVKYVPVDAQPTANSDNPVSSGGVYEAIQQGGGGGGAVTSVNGKTGAVTLDKSDIGLGNVDNVQQYSASNPPPYPVTSVNGSTGAVTVDGLSNDVKDALLQLAEKVAYIDANGQTYYDDLLAALYPLNSISAVYTQSGTVYDTDTLSDLTADLVVTALYEGGDTAVIPASKYVLSGSLEPGTDTITVTYREKTATFTVTVTDYRSVMYYAYSDGDLIKYNGTVTNDTTFSHGFVLNDQSGNTSKRRVFAAKRGKTVFYETDNPSSSDSFILTDPPLFPIPVPPSATKVTVAITPNTQYFGVSGLVLADGKYSMTLDDGWKQGSRTLTFAAGTYTHICLNCKQNSSGTDYTTEPTEMTVTFE